MRVRKCPFCVTGQYVGPWFVGSVCEASRCVFFSDGFPSGISDSVCEWCLLGLPANCSLAVDTLLKKKLEKIVLERKKETMHSAWFGQLVAESLGRSIDSRKEIDLWLLQIQKALYFPKVLLASSGTIFKRKNRINDTHAKKKKKRKKKKEKFNSWSSLYKD